MPIIQFCESFFGGSQKSVVVSPRKFFKKVWVPCHHGMAHPQVADRGDSLQILRVAVNILNKQSWTANKGWSSS
jgi:hypothetical protein